MRPAGLPDLCDMELMLCLLCAGEDAAPACCPPVPCPFMPGCTYMKLYFGRLCTDYTDRCLCDMTKHASVALRLAERRTM